MNEYNIKNLGAAGDGITDDHAAFQRALDLASGGGRVIIPEGNYLISDTLFVSSDTEIVADSGARVIHSGEKPKKRGDFLISNKNTVSGDENISLKGGIWDGNFDEKNNNKNPDIFDQKGCSGAVMNFVNVKNLALCDLTVANSVVYFVRMALLDGFVIEKIRFSAEKLSYNQDGLHFGGGCKNGKVKDIRAITKGETNDDMIALNADDCVTRIENLDLPRTDIENITFSDIYADDCYTFARLLSVNAAIKNITFENVYAGCRNYFLNLDGARYCRTPLFNEDEYPMGCGHVENITVKNAKYFCSLPGSQRPLVMLETVTKNLVMENAERLTEKEAPGAPNALEAKNLVNTTVSWTDEGGKGVFKANKKSDRLAITGNITSLKIDTE